MIWNALGVFSVENEKAIIIQTYFYSSFIKKLCRKANTFQSHE
jgi:hypothetical protein